MPVVQVLTDARSWIDARADYLQQSAVNTVKLPDLLTIERISSTVGRQPDTLLSAQPPDSCTQQLLTLLPTATVDCCAAQKDIAGTGQLALAENRSKAMSMRAVQRLLSGMIAAQHAQRKHCSSTLYIATVSSAASERRFHPRKLPK